jgi:hypothetical protein
MHSAVQILPVSPITFSYVFIYAYRLLFLFRVSSCAGSTAAPVVVSAGVLLPPGVAPESIVWALSTPVVSGDAALLQAQSPNASSAIVAVFIPFGSVCPEYYNYFATIPLGSSIR